MHIHNFLSKFGVANNSQENIISQEQLVYGIQTPNEPVDTEPLFNPVYGCQQPEAVEIEFEKAGVVYGIQEPEMHEIVLAEDETVQVVYGMQKPEPQIVEAPKEKSFFEKIVDFFKGLFE